MKDILQAPPYGERDDAGFLSELNALTQHHVDGCPEYEKLYGKLPKAENVEEVPFLHVGLFKYIEFRTYSHNIRHERVLLSSGTSGQSSMIHLDEVSSRYQAQSSSAILKNFVGEKKRPLLIIDSSKSLRRRGELTARVAAAMSLQPLSTEIHFLLDDPEDPTSMKWDKVIKILNNENALLIYGFTWFLWAAWANAKIPENVKSLLAGKQIHFVHSGGWKKLESLKIGRNKFDGKLLQDLDPSSCVIDYYGLVEQIGIIYPMCEYGFRHVPIWANVIVRDPYTLKPLIAETGQIQLLNIIALGAPYHSVLTEDLGRIKPGNCPCGRKGRRFELIGRIPKAQIRGCANV